MKYFGCLILFCLIFCSLHAQIIPFETIDFKDTEFESVGTTLVLEDKDEFLWLELYGRGLVRYDGKNIEKIYETVNLPSKIYDLYQDEYGYLWVLGVDALAELPILHISNRPVGVDLISDSLSFKNEQFSTPLLGNTKVRLRAEFSISSERKILLYGDSILIQYHYPNENTLIADTLHVVEKENNTGKIRSAIYLSDGSVVFSTMNNIFTHLEFNDNQETTSTSIDFGKDDDMYSFTFFLADQQGGVWASTDVGLVHIPNARQPIKETYKYIPLRSPIADMFDFDEKTILVGTQGQGLFEISKQNYEVVRQYNTNHGLVNPIVFSLKAGKERTWLATAIGPVSLANDYRAHTAFNSDYMVGEKPFLPADGVNATAAKIKLKGGLQDINAVCTSAGLVLFSEEDEHVLLDESNALNSNVIVGVCSDDNGRVWVSAIEGGVHCIFPKGAALDSYENIRDIDLFGLNYSSTFIKGYQFYAPNVFSMSSNDAAIATQEVLYGANGYCIQILVDNETWLIIEKKSGFKSNSSITLTAQDDAGHLYFGNNNGLMRTIEPFTREYYYQVRKSGRLLRKNKMIYTSEKIIEEIPLTWKDSVFQRVDGLVIHEDEIWATVNNGVLILSAKDLKSIAFIPVKESETFPPLYPQGLTYRDGSIWGGSSLGGLLEYDASTYTLKRKVLAGDGLLNDRIYGPKDLSVSSKGTFNYGTAEGLVRYNPTYSNPDTSDISVQVRDVIFSENNWGKNELYVSYLALTYDDPKTVYYKTRLSGFDKNWSTASHNTDIRYTNLSAFLIPKTYEFEIMAADYRGQWKSIKKPYSIKVYPPIWSRWWSLLLYALSIFFIARKYLHWRLEEQKKTIALEEAKIIKQQKEIIEKKNHENELLLKEIHHRVKNNLQTISSLLSLQSESITDQSALNAVQESKNRVASMALIHQKLYQRDNLAAIEMRDYFETIGKAIIQSFGERATFINLKVEMEKVEIDVDTAIPIGLITNELVTNSLKYAFRQDQQGEISINLSTTENNLLKLEVSDNGQSQTDEEASKDSGGFGTMLIQLLTTQLRGKLETTNENGMATTILFSLQTKSAI